MRLFPNPLGNFKYIDVKVMQLTMVRINWVRQVFSCAPPPGMNPWALAVEMLEPLLEMSSADFLQSPLAISKLCSGRRSWENLERGASRGPQDVETDTHR